jgi:GTPase SAR1 family protein
MQHMFEQYIEESVGFVVVYSIEDRATFDRATEILASIETIKKSKYKVILIGNRIDRQKRVVATNEGSRLAAKHNTKFFETSCATGENVQLAFQNLVG